MLSRILLIGMVIATMAFAQRGRRSEDPSAPMPAQRDNSLDQFAGKLKLNKEQRAQAETIIDAAREAAGPVQQKLLEVRRYLAAALITGQSSEADKLTKTYTSLSAQAKTLEANAFGKICALLKPNQQSKAAQHFGLIAQAVEQGQMGGPPGGSQPGQWSGGQGGRR
ncbi:MAG: Spy/CpxP family protein refolding chaperone [Bryobacteraceae bacterium]|jgi:Spy/CpxP family protein refolding chaperone